MAYRMTAVAPAIFAALIALVGILPASLAAEERKILHYRNPMGLPDISPVPKKDSMEMDYIPVYEDETSRPAGAIRVSLDKVQRAGVRIVPVERRKLIRQVRGAGTIVADESRIALVTAKFSGFVERLTVRTTGEKVTAGEPLFTAWIESTDLLRKMADLAALPAGGRQAEIAARNLRLFDVPEKSIEDIVHQRASVRTITINAPAGGTILEKPALDGMRFAAGDMLFKIADLSTVWVMTEVAEQDIALVRPNQTAHLTLPAMPGQRIEGVVDFIYPDLDMATRSGKVRIVIPNADGYLKLGLFVHAKIETPVDDVPVVAIPASAVIDDGTRVIVFVSKGDGLFEPRTVELGERAGEFKKVRKGLSEGENIVATGTFLIDAESNFQGALAAFFAETDAP